MYFDDGAVQTHRFDPDAHQLLMLQFLEQSIQNTRFRPAIHARVDRVPVAKALGQAAPFAAIFCYKQNRVHDLKVAERDIAALNWQKFLDPTELLLSDFHEAQNIT